MILSDDDIDGIRFFVLDELEKKAKVNWWDICKAVEETRGKQASMDAEQFLIDIANKTGQKVAQSQNAQTRQDTLREFGKWLDKHVVIATEQEEVVPGKLSVGTATYGFHTKEWHELLDSLKRGEMPEQSRTKEMR